MCTAPLSLCMTQHIWVWLSDVRGWTASLQEQHSCKFLLGSDGEKNIWHGSTTFNFDPTAKWIGRCVTLGVERQTKIQYIERSHKGGLPTVWHLLQFHCTHVIRRVRHYSCFCAYARPQRRQQRWPMSTTMNEDAHSSLDTETWTIYGL